MYIKVYIGEHGIDLSPFLQTKTTKYANKNIRKSEGLKT
jgi:hypothetical protein